MLCRSALYSHHRHISKAYKTITEIKRLLCYRQKQGKYRSDLTSTLDWTFKRWAIKQVLKRLLSGGVGWGGGRSGKLLTVGTDKQTADLRRNCLTN